MTPGTGDTSSDVTDVRDLHDIVEALARWVPELLAEPVRAAEIIDACRVAAVALDPSASFADGVAAIERAAHTRSRHLLLFVDEAGALTPDDESLGWPPPDMRAIRRRAGSVRSVGRTTDGIATIRVDGLDPFDVVEPFLEAALALAERAAGIVVDLRANGGGDPATVAYLAGFVLGPDVVALSEVHGSDGVVAWSTAPPPAHLCVPAAVPVAVLTSASTFSSAEALAYHLQVRGRVTVFGEITPGAADHVTPIVLTRRVHAQMPVARVVDTSTGSSWEGVGVRPDVACAAFAAEDVAVAWIRDPNHRSND